MMDNINEWIASFTPAMTVDAGLLAAGILIAVLAIVFLHKRHKAGMAALLITGAVLVFFGLGDLHLRQQEQEEAQVQIYLGAEYLKTARTDLANYHLEKVEEDSYALLAAKALLEKERGNDVTATLRLDAAGRLLEEGGSRRRKGILDDIAALNSASLNTDQLADIAGRLQRQLDLSDAAEEEADYQLALEAGNEEDAELSAEDEYRAAVNVDLLQGTYTVAVADAVDLVRENPSARNRMILADTVAEAAYNNVELDEDLFLTDDDGRRARRRARKRGTDRILGEEEETAAETADGMHTQTGSNPLSSLFGHSSSSSTTSVSDSASADTAQTQENSSSEEENSSRMADHLDSGAVIAEEEDADGEESAEEKEEDPRFQLVYRAISSIADQHSAESHLLRARLYFSIGDKENASQEILKAGSAADVRLGMNENVRTRVEAFTQAYVNDDTAAAQTTQYQDAMQSLLSLSSLDMIGIYSSSMTSDMVAFASGKDTSYGQAIYITGIDVSAFPTITVMLGGNEDDLAQLSQEIGSGLVTRDTHEDVSVGIVSQESGEETPAYVCAIVDESGSMDGSGTEGLKNALRNFIDILPQNMYIGIIGFEDSSREIFAMSNDHGQAREAVDNIHASGGTNITAGIQGAMEQLENVGGSRTVLLMTDGQSDIDMNVVEEAAAQNLHINTIGFGDVNETLLQEIADVTGGQYIHTEDADELTYIYSSLAGSIGNQLVLTYTVSDTGGDDAFGAVTDASEERYFFIRNSAGTHYARRTYTVTDGSAAQTAPQITAISPAMLTHESLMNGVENDEGFRFTIYGTNLQNLQSITIGGKAFELDQDQSQAAYNGYVSGTLREDIGNGASSVAITGKDGSSRAIDQMIYVYDEEQTINGRFNFMAGSLYFTNTGAMVLDQDTLYFSSVLVRDTPFREDSSQEETLFEAQLQSGVVSVQLSGQALSQFTSQEEFTGSGYYAVNLGKDTVLHGTGLVYLGGNDASYTGNGLPVLSGSWEIQADNGIHLVMKEAGQ